MPTKSSVCPWALLLDIAKHGLIGNWHLLRVNGSSVSDGVIVILHINTCFPLFTPLAISNSSTLSPSFWTINQVPFHSPFPGPAPRFLNNMTGAPTLSVIECGGIPDRVIELRKSIGYVFCKSSSTTESASPGDCSMMSSFILSTLSFIDGSLGHKIFFLKTC